MNVMWIWNTVIRIKTPKGEIEKATKLMNEYFSEKNYGKDKKQAFCLAETLKEERLRAGLTQQELADRIGTKKNYISRLENGKSDVQLNTLYRIFEGLGKRVALTIV